MGGFDEPTYDEIRPGCQASAAAVVPVVLDVLRLWGSRVVDVGCGEGWWARAFRDHDCQVLGVDAGDGAGAALEPREFCSRDLEQPLEIDGDWDLAVALEVAEHLQSDRGASFVAELCALAPMVLFSAAIPGQGGYGHVNEQWPEYWIQWFKRNGFDVSGALRWQIWNDERVEPWYRQNLLVAARNRRRLKRFGHASPVRVVHPAMFELRRDRS